MLDIDFVRSHFPAFSEPSLEGMAFFENAGGSYTCAPVIDRLTRFYHERKVQPYAPYDASRLGGEEMDEARLRLAALLGVETDEVSFGPSTTQNTYVLAQAFRQFMSPGEAIIVTNQDHEANTGPWRRLADEGIEVREWRVNPETGHLDTDDLQNLLDDRVRLVCFPHCSNVVGEINPVLEITALCHAAGAFVCVDGVSYAPHGFANVGEMGPDIYLFSSYKTYGPHQGIMVMRRHLGQTLPNQGHYFNADTLYKRFTPAGPDHAQVAACAGMADYMEALGAHHGVSATGAHDLMRAHEVRLLQPLLDAVKGSQFGASLIGPSDASLRAPTVDAGAQPARRRGCRRPGGAWHHVRGRRFLVPCARLRRWVWTWTRLRHEFVHYTSQAEVSKVIAALDAGK